MVRDFRNNIRTVSAIKDIVHDRFGGALISLVTDGSHMYGLAGPNSDTDLRGCYMIKTDHLLGLHEYSDNMEINGTAELSDVKLNELRKELGLALKSNANVLERIMAPQVFNHALYFELKEIVEESITKKGLYESYNGMAVFNFAKFVANNKMSVKKYLFIIRALLAGTYALETGQIQPNIGELLKYFAINDELVLRLVDLKRKGHSDTQLEETDKVKVEALIDSLFAKIDEAYQKSKMPTTLEHDQMEKADKWLRSVRRKYIA